MSWKDAKIAAAQFVQDLRLPEDLTGRVLSLKELREQLPFEGTYRDMVLRAALRELRRRKAKVE